MRSRVLGIRAGLATLLLLVLASCIPYAPRPVTDPRTLRAVRDYYNAHAAEPQQGCSEPLMVLMREVANIGSAPSQSVLRMRARFDFEQRDPQTKELICSGVGERFFTMQTVPDAPPIVLGMSGSTRPRT